uniref:Uncharacterized protein n=1 Tax=Anguilla anguilla TaxID=7936 RepID=A0A0E9VSD0_ANGAN
MGSPSFQPGFFPFWEFFFLARAFIFPLGSTLPSMVVRV